MSDARFEDQFSFVGRQGRRFLRALRWRFRGVLGLRRRVLVELRWRLGDEIMALPALAAFHLRYPGAELQVLTNYPELYEGLSYVRPVSGALGRIDRYVFLREASRRDYRLDCYARRLGVPVSAEGPRLHLTDWGAPSLAGDGPLVALARGASWSTKRWPEARWNALAEGLEAAGVRLVVLGVGEEGIAPGLDLVGKTTVREAACVLRHADALVCCDSGLMHLGLAVGTPVVALFGPTDPLMLVRGEAAFHAIRSGQECSGFWNHAEAVPGPGVCPYGHDCCLDTILVEDVLGRVMGLFSGKGGAV